MSSSLPDKQQAETYLLHGLINQIIGIVLQFFFGIYKAPYAAITCLIYYKHPKETVAIVAWIFTTN